MIRTANERNCLVEKHLELAIKLAKQRHRSVSTIVQYDDLLSAAYLGLIDAAEKFDETKVHEEAKKPFAAYARPRILGEMNDYLRSCNWGSRSNPRFAKSLDACQDFLQGIPLKDALTDDGRNLVDAVNGEELFDKIIRPLPRRAKIAFKLRYRYGFTMGEIAERVNLSESRISQILSQYVVYLKKVWGTRQSDLWNEVNAA